MSALKIRTSVVLILFIIILAACNLPGSAQAPTATLSAEQLAQTAVASGGDPAIETSIAETLVAMGQNNAPTATLPPAASPSDTPLPENTPSIPIIHVSVNTNCRYGPGIVYDPPVNVFSVGNSAEVFGRSPDSSFYYIDLGCYVWSNYVTVEAGNINSVPIYTPVASPTPSPTPDLDPWDGAWNTDCAAGTCDQMTLEQNGNLVTGSYAGGDGSINASVSGNHLTGTWSRGILSGSIDFWMNAAENRWHGNYGSLNKWCGAREGLSYLNPCGVSSWYGAWTTDCGLIANCSTMTLTQNGVNVSGSYAGGDGSVSGTVSGATFSGTWTRGGNSGPITFYMKSGGNQFQGNYGGASAWCGRRNGAIYPVPCLKN